MYTLKSIIITLTSISGLALVACDDGAADTAPSDTTLAPNTAAKGDSEATLDPMLMATCHAASRDADSRIAAALAEATVCKTSAECTIAVTETRCTGELVNAVSRAGEAGFIDFVERVDTRVCGDLPSECVPPSDPDPRELEVACVSNRCLIVPCGPTGVADHEGWKTPVERHRIARAV
jgi:hypothetical protein